MKKQLTKKELINALQREELNAWQAFRKAKEKNDDEKTIALLFQRWDALQSLLYKLNIKEIFE